MIHRVLVLSSGLPVMAPLAESLPVRPVPEEPGITPVRDYVVDDCCLNISPFLQALPTERLDVTQKRLAGLAPGSSISTAGRRPYLLWVQSPMLLAVLLSPGHQFRTAGVRTGMIRRPRHHHHSFHHKSPAGQNRGARFIFR